MRPKEGIRAFALAVVCVTAGLLAASSPSPSVALLQSWGGAHVTATSAFGSDAINLSPLSESASSAVLRHYPIDCQGPDGQACAQLAGGMQGALICSRGGRRQPVSTGILVAIEADRQIDPQPDTCRIVVPAHALVDHDDRLLDWTDCEFALSDHLTALGRRSGCEETSRGLNPPTECVGLGTFSRLLPRRRSRVESLINLDQFSMAGFRGSANQVADFATLRVNPASSLCTSAPRINISDLRAINSEADMHRICTQGIAICAAFTGGASGERRCVVRTVSQVIDGLENNWSQPSPGIVFYHAASFKGASGAGHYCLRGGGMAPIPLFMSVAMARYRRGDTIGELQNEVIDARLDGTENWALVLPGQRYRTGAVRLPNGSVVNCDLPINRPTRACQGDYNIAARISFFADEFAP